MAINYVDHDPFSVGPDDFDPSSRREEVSVTREALVQGPGGPLGAAQRQELHQVAGVAFALPPQSQLYAPDQAASQGGGGGSGSGPAGAVLPGEERINLWATRGPTKSLAVGANPVPLLPADPGRLEAIVVNAGFQGVSIGDKTVTYGSVAGEATAGIPIAAGATFVMDGVVAPIEWWVVGPPGSAGIDIRVLEATH